MKRYLLALALFFFCFTGCSEFAAGVGAGISVTKHLQEKAAKEKLAAEASLEELRIEKEAIQELITQIKDSDVRRVLTDFLDPNTLTAIDEVKDSINEPEDYISYGIAALGLIVAYYQRRKRMRGL